MVRREEQQTIKEQVNSERWIERPVIMGRREEGDWGCICEVHSSNCSLTDQ